MATAKGIKLPVVITADGTQAQAGFAKLRNSMQGLERGFGKYLSRQASALTGMVTGFFTVDSLFSGIQKLLAHGAEVNKRIAQFSPEAVRAQSQLEAAQLRQDVAMAQVLGPDIAARAGAAQVALPETGAAEAFAATLATEGGGFWDFAKAQVGRLVVGDLSAFKENALAKQRELFGQSGEILGVTGPSTPGVEEMEERLRMLQATAPMPAFGVPLDKQSQEVQQSVETINLLREAVQELRGMNRQLKAN